MKLKKLSIPTLVNTVLADDPKKDYARLTKGEITPLKGIPRFLKPRKNVLSGETEITAPDGRKEYYKEERGLSGSRYVKVR